MMDHEQMMEIRLRSRWARAEVAWLLGVSRAAVHRWEKGETAPPVSIRESHGWSTMLRLVKLAEGKAYRDLIADALQRRDSADIARLSLQEQLSLRSLLGLE